MFDLILFGIQGSGKGTQAKYLAEEFDMVIFEMGAELREFIKGTAPLARKVKSIVESGNLVPDKIISKILNSFLDKLDKNKKVIFDGIPRTLNQASLLIKKLEKAERAYMAILIKIRKKEAWNRLRTRRICAECQSIFPYTYKKNICEKCGGKLTTRIDDTNLDSINTRFKKFEDETVPVINKLKNEGKLIEINGEQDIEKVEDEIILKVKNFIL